MTSAEDINRVVNGNEDETEDGDEDYDEEHEPELRGGPNIKSGNPRALENQRGKSCRGLTLAVYFPYVTFSLSVHQSPCTCPIAQDCFTFVSQPRVAPT